MWTDQATDWVSINQRSWEFESFQPKVQQLLYDFSSPGSDNTNHVESCIRLMFIFGMIVHF